MDKLAPQEISLIGNNLSKDDINLDAWKGLF